LPRPFAAAVLALTFAAARLSADEPQVSAPVEPKEAASPAPVHPLHFGGEIKFAFRHSTLVETPLFFPFPPNFVPAGQTAVVQRTVAPGSSLELPNVAVLAEGDLSSLVSLKVEVHFLDLYNRNPTSSDDRILVREAWIRFGRFTAPLDPPAGSSLYVLTGLAPRFTKQTARRLESYGLLGTAVGRFEQPQMQIGGTAGSHVLWRAQAGSGNPLFFRDPNALAGDNGTPNNVPGSVNPIYNSGFPILYDAKPDDLDLSGRFEWGAGLGLRAGNETHGVSALGWYFHRRLEDGARIRGTFYRGDIVLLQGVGFPLPFEGRDKREWGVNVEARAGGLRFFGQYLDQVIAQLPRRGFEAEVVYRIPIGGAFLLGETPFLEWAQPVVRVSYLDNRFTGPIEYPGQSVLWDWLKIDVGLRLGLLRNVDLTAEYSFNTMFRDLGNKHPNEGLVTLRAGF
jgi:hypothetical protein